MNGINFVINHTGIWLDIWVFLAIIAFSAVIAYFIVRRRSMVKMEEELEDLLKDKYEREAVESDESDKEENHTNEDSIDENE